MRHNAAGAFVLPPQRLPLFTAVEEREVFKQALMSRTLQNLAPRPIEANRPTDRELIQEARLRWLRAVHCSRGGRDTVETERRKRTSKGGGAWTSRVLFWEQLARGLLRAKTQLSLLCDRESRIYWFLVMEMLHDDAICESAAMKMTERIEEVHYYRRVQVT